MDVAGILRRKGREVATVEPEATVAAAIEALAEHRVGALVVTTSGETVEGILSERDIVRRLYADGAALLDRTVAEVCTTEVTTCRPDDGLDELMRHMTTGRFRHLPVLDDDERLVGIVSIGDVVKDRVDELESINRDLESYVSGTW